MPHNTELIEQLENQLNTAFDALKSGSGVSRSRGDAIAKQANALVNRIKDLKLEPEIPIIQNPIQNIFGSSSISPIFLIGLIGVGLIILGGRK